MDGSDGKSAFGNPDTVVITGKILVVAIIILFLVVVFVVFLHLYAKWFWWRVEQPITPRGGGRRQRRRFVFAPGQDPLRTTGLDDSIIRSLPVVVFKPEDFENGLECAVCLSEVEEGEKARLLPKCNHGFHVDCIDMWFQSHSTCPICRHTLAPPDSDPNSNSNSNSDVDLVPSRNENLVSVYTMESPNLPTNVLFWGNQIQVNNGVSSLEGNADSVTHPQEGGGGMMVIDIPPVVTMFENLSSSSPPSSVSEEELKSPVTTRLRSLKRLLSRDKRVLVSSSNCSSSNSVVDP